MEEHRLKSEGLVEKSDILKLGRFTAVQAIVVGNIVPMEDQYQLILRIVTTDTAATLGAIPVTELARTAELMRLEGRPLRSPARTSATSSQRAFVERSATASDKSCRLRVIGSHRTDEGEVVLDILHQSLRENYSAALLKPETYIVDERGQQYSMRRADNIPYLRDDSPVGEFERKDFPAGIPIRYAVTFSAVPSSTRSLNLVVTYAVSRGYSKLQKALVTVSDIGL